MVGIVSYGCHVPRYRLDRKKIYKAIGWVDPSTVANSRGSKAVANFDEDSITMAVAASSSATRTLNRTRIGGVYFGSTTMPYKERLNAGIISAALGLNGELRSADFSGGLRAGTSAMLSAIEGVAAKQMDQCLVCAADCRLGKPASAEEMIFGDAGVAFGIGHENVIAEFKGSYCLTYDFMDHFRGEFAKFDRKWEDRWIRDMGYNELIPSSIQGLLDKYNLKLSSFSKVIYDCQSPAARKKLNKILGINSETEQQDYQDKIGHCGVGQSLLMLAASLDEAQPGDKILLVSFGNGCEALYFEVTETILQQRKGKVVDEAIAKEIELDLYEKYLAWRDILPVDTGLRSEEDLWTRPSALWRLRKEVTGLCGSRCQKCGTPQFPPQRVCVNPECGAVDEMEDYLFSDKTGRIVSYTGDMLAASFNPPTIYGAIEFDEGGKFYFEFTDCELPDLVVGQAVKMTFRRKYLDKKRGISGYFWKAIPVTEEK